MNNDQCILIKKKDFDQLKEQVERSKPDYIKAHIEIGSTYGYGFTYRYAISSNITLHESLKSQLLHMYKLVNDKVSGEIEKEREKAKKETLNNVANMSRTRRKQLLKQYKNK